MRPEQFRPRPDAPQPIFSRAQQLIDDLSGLVPKEVHTLPGIIGESKLLVTHTKSNTIKFVVFDEGMMTAEDLDDNFKYFSAHTWLDSFKQPVTKDGTYPRPVLHGAISHFNDEILFVDMLEVNEDWHGQGLGSTFTKNLVAYAPTQNYQFICGYQNDAQTARFFVNRGRYLLEDIKSEFVAKFEPIFAKADYDHEIFVTIQILNPADVTTYVKADHLMLSIDQRLALAEKRISITQLLSFVEDFLERAVESGFTPRFEKRLVSVIGLINTLELSLPPALRSNLNVGELSAYQITNDPDLAVELAGLVVAHLKMQTTTLLQYLPDEQLEHLHEIRIRV